MKRCPGCGKLYSDVISVCPKCNISLNEGSGGNQTTAQFQQPANHVSQPTPVQYPINQNPQPAAQAVNQPVTQSTKKMPSKGKYCTMLVFSFIFGILWGALAFSPYKKMSAAIDAGDAETAWANAKKVNTFFWIGVGLNVAFLLLSAFANM